ncbi:MAG: hypothetical protein PVF81_06700 [Thioalkalispiraceae bacterium]
MSIYEVDKLLGEARRIAAEYRRTTGTSLPITSEIAKHDACVYLELEPANESQGGYDAQNKDGLRIQVKGRAIFDESKGGQRLGQMKLEQEWDALAMVLMDENFETTEIYLATRDEIETALQEQVNSKRSKRGAMSVARFKHIARLVWTREEGRIDDEIWTNQP